MGYIPTLSEDHYVDSIDKKLDHLVSYFILSDVNQSLLFRGDILSLAFTYYSGINEPQVFENKLRSDLSFILEKYFRKVDVDIEIREKERQNDVDILLYVSVMDDNGNESKLSKIVIIRNSKIEKLINITSSGFKDGLLTAL